MTREVVLDTETTGLDPATGDRIVEIGCVELFNHVPTGRTYQTYIDPERSIPAIATEVSGITDETVRGKPRFAEIVADLFGFLAEDPLVIHNASFDLGFLNAELTRIGQSGLPATRALDTLMIARRKFPGAPASLDALCRRFNIDTSERVKHGALVDARLLAAVYLELIGGRQPGLLLPGAETQASVALSERPMQAARTIALEPRLSDEERAAHAAFVEAELGPSSLWRRLKLQ
jgi:DNA polymerase-3 subunit epsilon